MADRTVGEQERQQAAALERDEQVAEWIKLTTQRDQSRQVDAIESKRADGKGHRKESGVRKAARELNISEADARRAVKVASPTPGIARHHVELEARARLRAELRQLLDEPLHKQVLSAEERQAIRVAESLRRRPVGRPR